MTLNTRINFPLNKQSCFALLNTAGKVRAVEFGTPTSHFCLQICLLDFQAQTGQFESNSLVQF